MTFTTLKAAVTALLLAASAMSVAPGAAIAQSGTDTTAPAQTPAPTQTQTPQVVEMTLGQAEAPVEVIEYASFTCPHCKNFHAGPLKKLKSEYIDTDKINFIYREIYFDRFGLWAGMVARCGGPARYFGLADLLYEKQSEWSKGDPATVAGNLRRLGKSAGLGDEQLEACLSDADKAKAMIEVFEETSKADDINSTPSFVINGTKYSNMSYEDFSEVLDKELAE